MTDRTPPYSSKPAHLVALGLQPVFCTPNPIVGTTGYVDWPIYVREPDSYRLAFRPPSWAWVMDVDDHHGDGAGPAALTAMINSLGPPAIDAQGNAVPLYRLSARGADNPAGRYLFRIPPDLLIDNAAFRPYGSAIDSVRTGHRFSFAPGDIHPGVQQPVRCYVGTETVDMPAVADWPELAPDWIAYFRTATERPVADMPQIVEREPVAELGTDNIVTSAITAVLGPDWPTNSEGTGPQLHSATMRVVGACFDAGLSIGQALTIADAVPLIGDFAAQRRTDVTTEVRRAWGRCAADTGPEPAWLTEWRTPSLLELVTNSQAPRWRALGASLLDGLVLPTSEGMPPDVEAADTFESPSPDAPYAVAELLLQDYNTYPKRHTLGHWRGDWYQFAGSAWSRRSVDAVRSMLYERLDKAWYAKQVGKLMMPVRFNPDRKKISDVAEALALHKFVHIDDEVTQPSWLVKTGLPDYLVAVQNGLLDPATGKLHPSSPAYFTTVAIPGEYDPDAPPPAQWLGFLDALWPDDPEAIALLQQWCGYVLSGRTHLQKGLMLIGPPRSGKGTIAHVLRQLVGAGNYAGVTLASLATNFGLEPLIGKTMVAIPDARPATGRGEMATITERLLSLTGEDVLEVPRKYKTAWRGQLPGRIMIMSNETPNFRDASNAITNRFHALQMTTSWLGREDTHLSGRLTHELPGILRWALDGLTDLTNRDGRFTQPGSGAEIIGELSAAASPETAFIQECCEVGPLYTVACDKLRAAYQGWANANGMDHMPTADSLGRKLRAVLPYVKKDMITEQGRRFYIYRGIKLRDGHGSYAPFGPNNWSAGQTPAPPCTTIHPLSENNAVLGKNDDLDRNSLYRGSFQNRGAKWYEGVQPPEKSQQIRTEPTPDQQDKKNVQKEKNAAKKYAARAAAVEQAMGEPTPLPVIVNRAGVVLPTSTAGVREMLAALGDDLTVDVETTGYPLGHADYGLRTIQLGTDQIAVVLDATDPEQCAAAAEALEHATVLRAYSAQADLVPLVHAGLIDRLSAWERMHDVVISTKLAEPMSAKSDSEAGLKATAARVLGDQAVAPAAERDKDALFRAGRWLKQLKVDTPRQRSGWANVDMGCTTMARYGASDVLDTHALALVAPELPLVVLSRERTVQRLVSRVSHDGLRLDADYTRSLRAQKRAELEKLGNTVKAFGIESPSSPAQVATRLAKMGAPLPVTAGGRLSVAKDAITPLLGMQGDVGELARTYAAYTKIGKGVTAFLDPWMTLIERGDSRVRPTVYTLEARTGRMSCVQQDALIEMPRDLVRYPDGVPITEVRAGDWVYAFDHNRELVLKQVKWCAQTGVRQTVVIIAVNSEGERLTLRATPEHLIRLYNGDWRAAGNLMHQPGRAHRDDGPRVMTMVRRFIDDGYVKYYPHANAKGNGPNGGGRNREHRWVAGAVRGRAISTKWDVHHRDGNKLNNHPDNLEPMPAEEHRGNTDLARGVEQGISTIRVGANDYYVVSVEMGVIEPVWDMEVEDVHNFVANGICVHNCVRPNLQQIPRGEEYRRCIIADEGHRLIGADFSQVEIRVGAILSGDPQLAELVARGVKVHTLIAEQVHPDGFNDDQYAWIKNGVFAWLYGSGIPNIADTIHGTLVQANTMVDTLKRIAPQLVAWTKQVNNSVRSGITQYSTYSGRIIHLREAHSAPNYCVQGTARELLVDAYVKLDSTRYRDSVTLPVHDEILLMVKEDEADDATETLVQCMEQRFGDVDIVAAPAIPSHTWPVH